jgi:hypothetical protein
MAYVKLTGALRQHIKSKAYELFTLRIDQNEKAATAAFDGQQIVDALVSSATKQILNQVPPGFLNRRNELNINLFGFYSTIKFHRQAVPLDWLSHGRWSDLEKRTDIPCVAALKEFGLKRDALFSERDELQRKVQKLLEAATSLQQVHELWPTVLDLVPDDIRERFHKVYSRREATQTVKQDLSEIFNSEMKTSLIKATMLKDAV